MPSEDSYQSLIERVLDGARRKDPPSPDFTRKYASGPEWYLAAGGVALVGALVLFYGISNVSLTALLVGSGMMALGGFTITFLEKQRSIANAEWAMAINHERQKDLIVSGRLDVIIGHLTAADIERHRTERTFSGEDLKYLWEMRRIELTQEEAARVREHEAQEAKKRRDHESSEAEKDREARRNAVTDKVEAQIKLETNRHKLENPSTEEEKARKEFLFQHKMDTLNRIYVLAQTDPTTAETMFEMWKRGEL